MAAYRLTPRDIERLGGRSSIEPPGCSPATAALADDRRARPSGRERWSTRRRQQVDGFARMMRTMQAETRGFGRDWRRARRRSNARRRSPRSKRSRNHHRNDPPDPRQRSASWRRPPRKPTRCAPSWHRRATIARRDTLTGLPNRPRVRRGVRGARPRMPARIAWRCATSTGSSGSTTSSAIGVGDRVLTRDRRRRWPRRATASGGRATAARSSRSCWRDALADAAALLDARAGDGGRAALPQPRDRRSRWA